MSKTVAKNIIKDRIKAFDILRGFFLVVILINHIELYPSLFDYFTGRGRLMVSAAEGFFFLAGLLVGLVYKRRISNGIKFIFMKMWRRSLILYLAAVSLTLLFTALAASLNVPHIKQGFPEILNWTTIITQTLLLQYEFGWADFLSRFAIYMFVAPFAFYLLIKGKWWILLALSIIAWLFRGQTFLLSWQIIFILGMIAGYYWKEIQQKIESFKPKVKKRLKFSLFTFTAITFIVSYSSVFILSVLNDNVLTLKEPWQSFTYTWNNFNEYIWIFAEKWTMEPLRIILFITWFSTLYMLTVRYEQKIQRFTKNYFELMGKNGLFVYVSHAFIVFIFKLFIPSGTNLWQNFLITAAALMALIASTIYYLKLIDIIRNRRAVEQPAGLKNS